MDTPFSTWAALLPPTLAIGLAFATRRALLSLGAGAWVGATLLAEHDPLLGLWRLVQVHILGQLTGQFHLLVVLFIAGLLGMVGIMIEGGGINALATYLGRRARAARAARLATAGLGLAIFFDDYANTAIVGTTMRPVADRVGISRAKLAYLVDSTAAPVAGLALLSTWVGYEVGLLGEVLSGLGVTENPYAVFLASLPFRFYSIFTLVFVLLVAALGRDYGPMHAAEREAAEKRYEASEASVADIEDGDPPAARWLLAVVPVGLVVAATLVGLWLDGGGLGRLTTEGWRVALSASGWRAALAAADSSLVLAVAAGVGSASAASLALAYGRGARAVGRAWLRGMVPMGPALAVLVLAWAMSDLCGALGTAEVLVQLLRGALPSWLVPVLVFGLACAVSFSTGSSWGTMALLLPTTIPLAFHLGEMTLTLLALGAVLEGSIFGDHCSPISDTTVLSAVSSGCDLMLHVRTQLPYALTTAAAALAFGYIPAALGAPPVLLIPSGVAVLAAVLWTRGRTATS